MNKKLDTSEMKSFVRRRATRLWLFALIALTFFLGVASESLFAGDRRTVCWSQVYIRN